ncbi:hypothetical protein CDV31_014726 [Fusarium ambrosium]|uniref:Mitochondrial carrier n=1 Tax=Fusarium ambrosium TaxID=131363 RepID=A0A428SUE9_9HYPO|nr:hypothetical protein CDV31_014726 [Fusarium ambrosium]
MAADVRGKVAVEETEAPVPKQESKAHHYKGFVAGVFSGIAKLTVGHPFDTVKVRLQTTDPTRFKGSTTGRTSLPSYGHGIAGIAAGSTVSFIAAPVEHIKARLQIQYAAQKADRLYAGPIDCLRKIYRYHGVQGVYHGLSATLLFRSFFFFWWASYDVLSRILREKTNLSAPAVNFWAGGLSAQAFWLTSYPSDVVKQRIMTDPLGAQRDKELKHHKECHTDWLGILLAKFP